MNSSIAPQSDGIYRGIPFADYLAWDAVSNSALSRFSRVPSAAHLPDDTAALAMGRALHCAILEPARFQAEYRIQLSNLGTLPINYDDTFLKPLRCIFNF